MKQFSLLCCLLIAFATRGWADGLTPGQKNAQHALYFFLDKNKYHPEVDKTDNSVCFRSGGVLYWINIDEESPMLFTFHRKGFKVGDEDTVYKRKPAIMAANEVNSKHKAVKLIVEEKKVDIALQAYAAKTEDFTAVLTTYLAAFNKVEEDFKAAYENAVKTERDAVEKVERDVRKKLPPSSLKNCVTSISFRILDADNKEKAAYDHPLRSFDARYIQARVEFGPWKDKDTTFTLQLKVTKPDGSPIYLQGKRITSEGNFTIRKSKKNQIFELSKFGTAKEGFWKAGEYKVELIETDEVIYTTTFNIL